MTTHPTVRVKPRKRKNAYGETVIRWAVKRDGKRTHRVVDTQAEAIQIGRRIAMNNGCELIVSRVDGTMRSHDTFRSDLLGWRK